MAFKLYAKEMEALRLDLSMSSDYATPELCALVGSKSLEPYRDHLKTVINKIVS